MIVGDKKGHMKIELVKSKTHRARPPYICSLCGGEIKTGERYVKVVENVDGRGCCHKLYHLHCNYWVEEYLKETEPGEYYCEGDVLYSIVLTMCVECDNHLDCDIEIPKLLQCSASWWRRLRGLQDEEEQE